MSGESQAHRDLVKFLAKEILDRHGADPDCVLMVDHEEFGTDRPTRLFNSEPDVLLVRPKSAQYFVGEAKTCGDLVTQHSKRQIFGHIEYLRYHKGRFYLMTPFVCGRSARALVEETCEAVGVDRSIAKVLCYG